MAARAQRGRAIGRCNSMLADTWLNSISCSRNTSNRVSPVLDSIPHGCSVSTVTTSRPSAVTRLAIDKHATMPSPGY